MHPDVVESAPGTCPICKMNLVPVRLEVSPAGTQARPLPPTGPSGLEGWARADALAVVPPGAGLRGDVVQLLDPYGRELWPGA